MTLSKRISLDHFRPGRRTWLRAAGAGLAVSSLPFSGWMREAHAADYRALVCVFLNGGCDGNDALVPADARYDNYARIRGSMALPRSSLAALSGTHDGGRYAMHPGLAPLAPLFDDGRLAWVANVGPLIKPLTVADAQAGRDLPPFLLSHSDQIAAQQGWLYGDDQSGWGGRALEALPANLRGALANVSLSNNSMLTCGRSTPSKILRLANWSRFWGAADVGDPTHIGTQALRTLWNPTFSDPVQAAYARSLRDTVDDASLLAKAFAQANARVEFPTSSIGDLMKQVAQMISVRDTVGAVRQVFLADWGSFDTHGYQRGTANNGLDGQLADLGVALAAFDRSVKAQGIAEGVTTFVMSDMGRTLQPAGDGGTDHSWGNHWFVFGDAVKGGKIYGRYPVLELGGIDDYDIEKRGRWLPQVASDQFAATLINWLGVPAAELTTVLPNLANFATRNLGFI